MEYNAREKSLIISHSLRINAKEKKNQKILLSCQVLNEKSWKWSQAFSSNVSPLLSGVSGEGAGKCVSDVAKPPSWGPQAETTQGLGVQVSNPEGKKVTDCAWLHFFTL